MINTTELRIANTQVHSLQSGLTTGLCASGGSGVTAPQGDTRQFEKEEKHNQVKKEVNLNISCVSVSDLQRALRSP